MLAYLKHIYLQTYSSLSIQFFSMYNVCLKSFNSKRYPVGSKRQFLSESQQTLFELNIDFTCPHFLSGQMLCIKAKEVNGLFSCTGGSHPMAPNCKWRYFVCVGWPPLAYCTDPLFINPI